MNVLTAVSSLMRRLASWKVLITTGALFLTAAVVFFASSLPFAIPTVTAACGQPPPDMRFFTSGDQVRQFLTGCGPAGRAAYQNMQIADLFYPALSGLFIAAAFAMVLTRLARPASRVVALAALPLLGSVFDYLENAAAWVTMTAYPQHAGAVTDLLGIASTSKQVCTWAAWFILITAIGMTLVRSARRRHPRRPAIESNTTGVTDQQQLVTTTP